jgi:ADP-ribose pyrophosphatase YjhB (NUDIX family)
LRRGDRREWTPPEVGHWSLPGGKVDFLERVEDAIRREVYEETGLTIRILRPLHLSEMIGLDGQHWVSPVYLAAIATGEATNREPEKADGVAWFPLDALPAPLAQAARDATAAITTARSASD